MEEMFEVVDPETHETVRQERRSVVHRTGLLHRAVYCWVFSNDNMLLLQKRSEKKKIGRSQWDLSLAEHLQPGESFREAVVRGLREELGIPVDRIVDDQQRLVEQNAVHRRELHGVNSVGDEYHDVELVQSFFCHSSVDAATMAKMITFDDGEVSDVRFVEPNSLRVLIDEDPAGYTAWLRAESALVGLSSTSADHEPSESDAQTNTYFRTRNDRSMAHY